MAPAQPPPGYRRSLPPQATGEATEFGSLHDTPSAPATSLQPGQVVDGKYRLVRRLGCGAMGEVWHVEHVHIRRALALKVLLGQRRSGNSEAAQRMDREARLICRIEHRNVIDVTDAGHLEDGAPYYAMELLGGRTLAELLASEGPLAWDRARELMRQLAAGLNAAHEAGVLHRDLKPANIFVVQTGGVETVKIIDFGIAGSTELDPEARRITQTGAVFGTPAYMSPEQARGERVDRRSDIYSLGCMMYEMLAGRRPFTGSTVAEILAGHLFRPPEPLGPQVPTELEAVVLRCMAKEPTERFASAGEVEAMVATTATVVGMPGVATTSVRPPLLEAAVYEAEPVRPGSARLAPWLFGALAALAIGVVTLWVLQTRRTESSEPGSATITPTIVEPAPKSAEPLAAPVGAIPPASAAPEPVVDDPVSDPQDAATEQVDSASATAPEDERSVEPRPSTTRRRPEKTGRRRSSAKPSSPAKEPPPSEPALPMPKRRDDGTFDVFPDE